MRLTAFARRKLRTLIVCSLLCCVAAIVAIIPVLAFVDRTRAHKAAWTDRPDILIEGPGSFQFPDPLHIKLANGKTYRLAHVIAPQNGAPEYECAIEAAWRPIASSINTLRGLRSVGVSTDGELLVELWGLQRSLGGCGSSTWAERRAARIPHWKELTWQLLASGYYRLEPGVADQELISWQSVAMREGQGVWGNPIVLRRFLDFAALEQTLYSTKDYGHPHTRSARIEAARVLLRADLQRCAPAMLHFVSSSPEQDGMTRILVAQTLDEAGIVEGTDFLINILRTRVVDANIDWNMIASLYHDYWNASWDRSDNIKGALIWYHTRILPTRK